MTDCAHESRTTRIVLHVTVGETCDSCHDWFPAYPAPGAETYASKQRVGSKVSRLVTFIPRRTYQRDCK